MQHNTQICANDSIAFQIVFHTTNVLVVLPSWLRSNVFTTVIEQHEEEQAHLSLARMPTRIPLALKPESWGHVVKSTRRCTKPNQQKFDKGHLTDGTLSLRANDSHFEPDFRTVVTAQSFVGSASFAVKDMSLAGREAGYFAT